MPRSGPLRKFVGIKLSDDERAAIDKRAEDEGVMWAGQPNTSEMIRRLCAWALEHMPTEKG